MSDELEALRKRISRIEIRDACISRFNEYLHYLDGELTQADSQRVRVHLEDCEECRRARGQIGRAHV